MSIYLHPYLTALWLTVFIAEVILVWITRGRFSVYAWAQFVKTATLLSCSILECPDAYFYAYWTGQAILHAIVLWLTADYAFQLLHKKPHLPSSFQGIAAVTMASLAGIVILIWHIRENPDAAFWLPIEQGITLILALAITLVCMLGESGKNRQKQRIMQGFLAWYLFSVLTVSMRTFLPATLEMVWAIDLIVQLGVVGWWIRTLSHSPNSQKQSP